MTFRIEKKPEQLRESRKARPYKPEFGTLAIYYIPGILGFSNEFDHIRDSLLEQSHNHRPIYCYEDTRKELMPDDNNQFSSEMYLTLDEQAQLIANNICSNITDIDKNVSDTVPIVIAAYSYGCSLSALIANKIAEQHMNAEISLYMIDGVTPQCAYQNFKNNSLAMNKNLIEIINYACKKAGYTQLIPQLMTRSIATMLKEKTLEEKFTYLEDTVKKLNNESTNDAAHKQFLTYFTIIKNDLTELSKANTLEEDVLAESVQLIKLIATRESQEIYQKQLLGWPEKENKTQLILKNFASVPHTELLSLQLSTRIAKSIHNMIDCIEHKEALKAIGSICDMSDDDTLSDSAYSISSDAYNSRSTDDEGYTTSVSPSETSEQEASKNFMLAEFSTHSSTYSSTHSSNSNTPPITHLQRKTSLNSEQLLDKLHEQQDIQNINQQFGLFSSSKYASSQPITCPTQTMNYATQQTVGL